MFGRSKVKSGALALAAALPYAFIAAQPKTPSPTVSFGRDVAPIFKAHCASCHSGAAASGGLDLATKVGILKGGTGGKLNGSLVHRIDGSKPPQMPMGMPALSPEDQGKLKTWVQEGMSFDAAAPPKHWAYIAPVPPTIPQVGAAWVKNPVDAFIFQKFSKAGLKPSPEASKETLIRRVSLDLIGLPPTVAEVDAFLADKSPQAYEHVVDRLLASPHYGERQAREWLDLARYADSDGYEKDLGRSVWLYRDWVINAYNQNLSYDKFTIDQIAGDLLPNATVQDKIATGFQRNTMQNLEGGVDQEEAHFLVELDRAETTSAVWLGSTLNCARCHDHKYDPFTQKDYYKMVAFYNNTAIYPRGPKDVGEEKWFEASLKAPTSEQAKQIDLLTSRMHEVQDDVKRDVNAHPNEFEAWAANASRPVTWSSLPVTTATSSNHNDLKIGADGSVLATKAAPDSDQYTVTTAPVAEDATGIRLEALTDPSLPAHGPGLAPNGNFVMKSVVITQGNRPIKCYNAAADYTQDGFDPQHLITGVPDAWAVAWQLGKPHELVLDFADKVKAGAPLKIVLTSDPKYGRHVLGKFRLSTTTHVEPDTFFLPPDLRATLGAKTRSDKILTYYQNESARFAPQNSEIAKLQAQISAIAEGEPTTLVMEEKPTTKALAEWVRRRGEFGSKTDLVPAGVPSILPQLPAGNANRLTLANWLVSKSNPLTARVQVNRMWEQIFGRGLVETSEDFGTRGSRPSHPELLDWLACRFMNQGWDMKALNRLLVTSATYKQSSFASKELLAKDPENRLLARGARFRMEAEMIHDVSLSAGGVLSSKIGGPSVFPYQPEGIWASPYSGQMWTPSTGIDGYRRGLYTFWKRTAPYPSFVALDASSRETCTVRRIRTNTPLQALSLLNDKLMLEAAAGLGKRMEGSGPDPAKRLSEGFELCTARKPLPTELSRLEKLEKNLETRFASAPDQAKKLGGSPTDAAYTMVGNLLLNLDETITKS